MFEEGCILLNDIEKILLNKNIKVSTQESKLLVRQWDSIQQLKSKHDYTLFGYNDIGITHNLGVVYYEA